MKTLNGVAPALIKQYYRIAIGLIAGIFTLGILYAEVRATGDKADDNRVRVEAIEKSIGNIVSDQRLLLQRFDAEKETNDDFQDKAGDKLDRILERLPRPVRREYGD